MKAEPPTSPQPTQDELFRRMTPAERLKIAFDLYETAWSMKVAGVRRQHPDWAESRISEKVRRVFMTGYAGPETDPPEAG